MGDVTKQCDQMVFNLVQSAVGKQIWQFQASPGSACMFKNDYYYFSAVQNVIKIFLSLIKYTVNACIQPIFLNFLKIS